MVGRDVPFVAPEDVHVSPGDADAQRLSSQKLVGSTGSRAARQRHGEAPARTHGLDGRVRQELGGCALDKAGAREDAHR
jgi:hypothetical protein